MQEKSSREVFYQYSNTKIYNSIRDKIQSPKSPTLPGPSKPPYRWHTGVTGAISKYTRASKQDPATCHIKLQNPRISHPPRTLYPPIPMEIRGNVGHTKISQALKIRHCHLSYKTSKSKRLPPSQNPLSAYTGGNPG